MINNNNNNTEATMQNVNMTIDEMIRDNQYFIIKQTMVELVSKLSKLPVTSKAWEQNSKDLEKLKKASPMAWIEVQ
tara:strand:+ start:1045 stop:1272 length:228 start_codon:yes stop_codon:yes gene_type:complete